MADLNQNQSSSQTQIVGSDEQYAVGVDSRNNLKVVQESNGQSGSAAPSYSNAIAGIDSNDVHRTVLTDQYGRIVITEDELSTFTRFVDKIRRSINPSTVLYSSFTFSANAAMKEFHVGGRVACEATASKYLANNVYNLGLFNSSGDVSAWTNTSNGSSALLSWSYATDQFYEGTGSAKMTFTQSDNNNYPQITYTFPTPIDLSEWRFIKAAIRVTVATGGNQSRQVQVRLTSGSVTRIYSITGTTTTAPFNTEQWHLINQEIESPSSTEGVGTFDINYVNSVSVRLLDGGNKSGSIWVDDVKFQGEFDVMCKIYSSGGTTTQRVFDPAHEISNGDVVVLAIRNNGASAGEIHASYSGVYL